MANTRNHNSNTENNGEGSEKATREEGMNGSLSKFLVRT
jgi:hypothetical protein